MIEIGSKTAEKNSAQTNRQTDRQTNRHYENNGHLAVNQKIYKSQQSTCKDSSTKMHYKNIGKRLQLYRQLDGMREYIVVGLVPTTAAVLVLFYFLQELS